MFAVVQVGSLQFKVAEGDVIDSFRLDAKEDKSITLDKVLMFANGTDIRIGQPFLKDVKVTAKVLQQHLDEKVVSFKFRKRKFSAWKKGHRQQLTAIKITKISV